MIPAIILCGGEGARLYPFTKILPKPLLPIDEGKPVVRHIIDHIRKYKKIRPCVLCIKKRDFGLFKNYIGEPSLDLDYSYIPEKQGEPMATGDRVWVAWWQFEKIFNSFFLVYYGDIVCDVDLKAVLSKHREEKNDATLVLSDEYRLPKGVALTNEGKVFKFIEKAKCPLPIWTGIAFFNTRLVRDQMFQGDIGSHVIPNLINEGYKVGFYLHSEKFIDIGTTRDLMEAQKKD